MIYLDTHVVAWLYAGRADLFPDRLLDRLANSELRVSPLVMLELQYLHEIGRLQVSGPEVVTQLGAQIRLRVCDLPFSVVVSEASRQSWTRDPFDRMIVGHAAAAGADLVTKDRTIAEHYARASWEAS